MNRRKIHFDRKRCLLALVTVVCLIFLLPAPSSALLLTIDQIIFEQDGSVNSAVLAGTADASLSDSTLMIILTNISTGVTGGAASTNLLTGIGFNLPFGVTIDGGGSSISLNGSTPINFSTLTDADWGGDNDVTSGPFQNVTTLAVNTAAATLQAAIDFDFNGLFTTGPPPRANVDGPSFGLLSGNVDPGTAGGQQAIQDSLTLSLQLNGLGGFPGDLLPFIDENAVVLAFGSPNTRLPEPGTLLLLGSGLVGLGVGTRKRNRRK